MKRITTTIKPFKLTEAREAFAAPGIQGMLVSEGIGFGRQWGLTESQGGAECPGNLYPKLDQIAGPIGQADTLIASMSRSVRTDLIGDGRICVRPTERTVRIRIGESGGVAL